MVRNAVIAAALAVGGLALAAPSAPASAASAALKSGAGVGALNADIMTVGRRWRGGRGYNRGRGWGYRGGYRGYRGGYRRGYWGPGFGVYVAPRYYGRRCWIDRYGYRVCRRY